MADKDKKLINFIVKQGDRIIFYMTKTDKGYTIPSPGGPTIVSQEELDMIVKATGFTAEEITDEGTRNQLRQFVHKIPAF